jgi:hypothetical protein
VADWLRRMTWTSRKPMLRPRGGMSGVVAHGCLYVYGGEGQSIGVFAGGLIYMPGGGTTSGGSSGSLMHQVYRPAVRCDGT